jgi:hypothetical protein
MANRLRPKGGGRGALPLVQATLVHNAKGDLVPVVETEHGDEQLSYTQERVLDQPQRRSSTAGTEG